MGFELFCMGLIALLFGLALAFLGYKLMWIMLPIFGFFFGLGLGAQTVQVLFGGGFLATITSWVVGFVVGAIFAALSYLFYFLAVAIISGAFGYGATVGILTAIGLNMNFLVWLIAIIVAVVVAFVVLRFNLQKWAVIIVTAIAGTSVIIFTLLAAFGQLNFLTLMMDPVRMAIQNSFLWLIFFLVVAGAGIWFQFVTNRDYEIEEYNRYAV
ncbi:MAG: DUF4203 domain-containing protein [Anaerolineae bacterium]|jgi:hypothetical protein